MYTFSELDLLKIVLSMEEDGVKLYKKMYENSGDDPEKRLIFSSLADEEEKHRIFFKDLYRGLKKNLEVDQKTSLFNRRIMKKVKSLVDCYKISDQELSISKKWNFKESINYAVQEEYKTIELYTLLIKEINDEKAREMLDYIIKEEEKHVFKLKEMIYYNKTSVSIDEHIYFVENILNGMQDLVRVVDPEDTIIYANDAMRREFGEYLIGKKCFEVLGRDKPCTQCISKQAAELCHSKQKEENINERIFSVMSSPLKTLNGELQAVIEVFRDITEEKQMQRQIEAQNTKFNHDLSIARKIQLSLLPQNKHTDKISFTYTYIPCEQIGGDFFDIFQIDSDHIGIYIADVSGHGVPASMLTVFLRQTIDKNEISPKKVLKRLYEAYNKAGFDTEVYITMFYAVIDTRNKEINYSNAGHNISPILFNANQMCRLEATGFPISNWCDQIEYQEYNIDFNDGDRLLFLTDGITDICNSSGERYNIEHIQDSLLKVNYKNIEEIKNTIVNDTYKFAYGKELKHTQIYDDITLLLLELNSPEKINSKYGK